MPAKVGQGFFLNDTKTATAVTAANLHERDESIRLAIKTWKPSPCLLTRGELRSLIAGQVD